MGKIRKFVLIVSGFNQEASGLASTVELNLCQGVDSPGHVQTALIRTEIRWNKLC